MFIKYVKYIIYVEYIASFTIEHQCLITKSRMHHMSLELCYFSPKGFVWKKKKIWTKIIVDPNFIGPNSKIVRNPPPPHGAPPAT